MGFVTLRKHSRLRKRSVLLRRLIRALRRD